MTKPACKLLILLLGIICQMPSAYAQCTQTEVTITTTTGEWGYEMEWILYNEAGEEVSSFIGGEDYEVTETIICVPNGCYEIYVFDSYGDGWNGGIVEMVWSTTSASFGLPSGSEFIFNFGINQEGCVPIVEGCTNAAAFNYDPVATIDDGTCQTLADVIAAQVFDTLCYSGTKDNRINWVIQNRSEEADWSNFADAEEFSALLNEHLISTFTNGSPNAQVPYAQYKIFFNIYASWWPDAPGDHTWWGFNVIQPLRDAIFLPWANDETGWATWFSLSKYGGGGGAGLDREARVGDGKMWGADDYETLLHEFAHTMPGLLDEYTASGEWSGGQCWETPNTTSHTILDSIPWRKWITSDDLPLPTPYEGQYENTIGAFEGALTNYFGCHRPTAKGCYMGAGGFGEGFGRDLCAPCVQRVICYLYKYVNVIENPIPASNNISVTGNEIITFSADVVAPIPNTQKYEWFLNGKRIAEGTTNVELTFGACESYELKFTVTDTTELVRYDEQFDHIYPKPYREHSWFIEQEDVNAYNLNTSYAVNSADCTGQQNGEVAFTIVGGPSPHEIWLKGVQVSNPVTNLPPGSHLFTIVDANGCSITEEITITQTPILDIEVCANYNDIWELGIYTENYNTEDVNVLWSNGESSLFIIGLPDGNHSVTATVNGCSVTQAFELVAPQTSLSVNDQSFPSETAASTGAIYVQASGGVPNYYIHWYDKPSTDPTAQFIYNPLFDGHFTRINLPPGEYRYEISDMSAACSQQIVNIESYPEFIASNLTVTQNDNCTVSIESPNPAYQYYWLSDEQGTAILGQGTIFAPPYGGNFYVVAANTTTNAWSNNRKGFAVVMPASPVIEELEDGTLSVVNPNANETYYWYETEGCSTPFHEGNTYMPVTITGQYFVSASSNNTYPEPIDPSTIAGLGLHIDASDLNGDGQIDDPAPETSSMLDWYFPTGNQWTENWFAYRSNYQNGLGIVDWATLWLQRFDSPHTESFQTVIMAYKENALSWEGSAPFEALSPLIPRHENSTQIFASDAPNATVNGKTFLNGQEINPLATPNPMQFCILANVFTEVAEQDVLWTDTYWEGIIGEMLFYQNALNDEQVQGVTEYLRQKWISTAELESPKTPIQWGSVGTNTPMQSMELSILPNPATDFIILKSNHHEPVDIQIYDIQGKLVFNQVAFLSTAQISIVDLPNGIYNIVATYNNRKLGQKRFIKM